MFDTCPISTFNTGRTFEGAARCTSGGKVLNERCLTLSDKHFLRIERFTGPGAAAFDFQSNLCSAGLGATARWVAE